MDAGNGKALQTTTVTADVTGMEGNQQYFGEKKI